MPELSFNVIMFLSAPGIVLHKEMLFQVVLGLNTLGMNRCLSLDSLKPDPG